MATGVSIAYSCRPATAQVRDQVTATAPRQPLPRGDYVGGLVAPSKPDDPAQFDLTVSAFIGGKVRPLAKADPWVIDQVSKALIAMESEAVVSNDRSARRFTEVPRNASDQ